MERSGEGLRLNRQTRLIVQHRLNAARRREAGTGPRPSVLARTVVYCFGLSVVCWLSVSAGSEAPPLTEAQPKNSRPAEPPQPSAVSGNLEEKESNTPPAVETNEQRNAREHFESKIRPLLIKRCIGCHGEDLQEGGLRLDARIGWQRGGDSGPAVVPGKPQESLLIRAVSYAEKDLRMPPEKELPPDEVQLLRDWIRGGAFDPRDQKLPQSEASNDWNEQFQSRLNWWSLQPVQNPPLPEVARQDWHRDPIDRFVLSAQEARGLVPAQAAEPEVLLRRWSFVLTGLPPSGKDRDQFLADWSQDADAACEHLVDRLLASPHYGERFARHWMDVVRYTDTYGYEWDNPAKGSWEYRDYLVRAWNDDLPYDQFVREQLAGDLLSAPRINPALELQENLIGPMFYHLGEHRHGSSLAFNGIHQEMIHNKIDAFSKAFLATTVACSRCHNHKLEAVSQRDYYAIAAMLMTPRWTTREIDAPTRDAQKLERLRTLRNVIREELAAGWTEQTQRPDFLTLPGLKAIVRPPNEASATKEPPLESISWPLWKLTEEGIAIPGRWEELHTAWKSQVTARTEANRSIAVLSVFASPDLPAGWVMEGRGFLNGYVPEGMPLIALDGDRAAERLLAAGYHSHALSSKLAGSLRLPPDHLIPLKHVSLQVAGGEYGGTLVLDANAFQNETVHFFNSPAPFWKTFGDAALINGVTKVSVDLTTAGLNPNFPPRTGLAAGLPHQDLGYDKRSWLSLTKICTHDGPAPPQDLLEPFASLFDSSAPKDAGELEQVLRNWFRGAVDRWSGQSLRPGDRAIVDWLLQQKLLSNTLPPESRLAKLVQDYREVEATIPFPRSAMSMEERGATRERYPLNIRGNVDTPGEQVTPAFLSMFRGEDHVADSQGSGRLELAEFLTRPSHPLTARVYVNRIWKWMFGAGLVATPDDFGHLGEKPSHPELLDYLATEFVRQGWSTRSLVRRIALSATFRQSGQATAVSREKDPAQKWLTCYPTRRLEAEAIRDAMLFVSGRLDPRIGGRPVEPYRTAVDLSKRLLAGPLDGEGRRSLYLKMSIMEPPKFLAGFNLPDLKLPTGRRDETNVPAQALIMLNDPLVQFLAEQWGERLLRGAESKIEDRVQLMFVQAYGRDPTPAETSRWSQAARELSTSSDTATATLLKDSTVWVALAHAMFNTKEFMYYR